MKPWLLFLFGFLSLNNQTLAQENLFSFEKYKNGNGDTLLFRKLVPDSDPIRKYPLVIFLHGSGERGNDNKAQLKWGVCNFATDNQLKLHPAYVLAPQCPSQDSWVVYPNTTMGKVTKTMQLVQELIHDFIKKNPIDSSRIYITGLSMGGFGTFDILERNPQWFAAAVPVCGGGDLSKAKVIAGIPIWIFTGAEDPAVNPALSFNMVQVLTQAGAHPGFTQYPETGHFSWIAAYSDPMLMEWLFRQHK